MLSARCVACHSGAYPQGGLDLSSQSSLLRGGASGLALKPGQAGGLLLRRVSEGTMPPKERLPSAEIEVLQAWVRQGAPWTGPALKPPKPTRAGLDWWSLQPLNRPRVPSLRNTHYATRLPDVVDAFVEARLAKERLRPNPPAGRRELLRRVTYDLHGLPPTPEELEAFVQDRGPGAYERVVDRLLASPRFGERFARRWLDVVRFAESDGYEHDLPRLNAWPYRDWVIDAFNRDLPYPEFVREQLAGDALHPGDPKAGIPTGFLVAGGYDAVGAKGASPMMRAEVRQDEIEDMLGVTGQALLGMTVQCARCHDHKFDPIAQRDYYRLAAALSGTRHWEPPFKQPFYGVRSEKPAETRLLVRGSVAAPGEVVTPGAVPALKMLDADLGSGTDPERRLRLARWITDPANPLFSRVIVNRVWGWLFGRGLVATPNDFGFNGARPTHPELLEWLAGRFASPRSQVPGPKDDWDGDQKAHLASGDRAGMGWSVKSLARALVLTRAYRRSSHSNQHSSISTHQSAIEKDPENRFLWRHAPRRLEAEELRDTLLLVSGKLNPARGGPGFQLFTWKENAGALYTAIDPDDPNCYRRAIYRTVVRGSEDPLLTTFDCPDASNTTPRRSASTTAVQALSLLNNSFTDRMAGAFAERLGKEDPVTASYRLALQRNPTAEETSEARAFVAKFGLQAWCRVLFNTSEFLNIE